MTPNTNLTEILDFIWSNDNDQPIVADYFGEDFELSSMVKSEKVKQSNSNKKKKYE